MPSLFIAFSLTERLPSECRVNSSERTLVSQRQTTLHCKLDMWAVTQDVSSAALANIKESNHGNHAQARSGYHISVGLLWNHSTWPILYPFLKTLDRLPDKILLKIFSYLPHREIGRLSRVCRKWRMISCDSRLWTHVSLRPEVSGLHVTSLETLLALITMRFGKYSGFTFQYIY